MAASISALSILVSLWLSSVPFGSANRESEFIANTIASHKIVIFSKSYCPYCRKVKSVFKELNTVPYVVELNQRDDGAKIQDAMMVMIGRRTVPQVFVNGKIIGGSEDTVAVYESGELAELLGTGDRKADL